MSKNRRRSSNVKICGRSGNTNWILGDVGVDDECAIDDEGTGEGDPSELCVIATGDDGKTNLPESIAFATRGDHSTVCIFHRGNGDTVDTGGIASIVVNLLPKGVGLVCHHGLHCKSPSELMIALQLSFSLKTY